MKIGVCIKSVPDTETRVKIGSEGKRVSLSDVSFIISPYDEYAIEEALQLRDKAGDSEVVLISVGDDDSVKVIRNGLAMGADRAILVNDSTVNAYEPFDVARTLAAVIRAENIDLALFGKQGVGQDYHQMAGLVAEILGWPQVSLVVGLELENGKVTAHREIEGGEEVVTCNLPAVLSAQKGLNEPRYPSLKGIMAAKKKTVENRSLSDLSLEAWNKATWEVLRAELPPARAEGKLLEGEPEDQVKQLVELLHNEAKVI